MEADVRGRNCRYPAWFLTHTHWQTLDGRWTYNLHKNSTLRITNITQQQPQPHGNAGSTPSSNPHPFSSSGMDSRQEQKAVCHSVLDLADQTARVVVHISQGWYVGCGGVFDVPSSLSPWNKRDKTQKRIGKEIKIRGSFSYYPSLSDYNSTTGKRVRGGMLFASYGHSFLDPSLQTFFFFFVSFSIVHPAGSFISSPCKRERERSSYSQIPRFSGNENFQRSHHIGKGRDLTPSGIYFGLSLSVDVCWD